MRSIQTGRTVALSAVKPLEGLRGYRGYCLDATRRALAGPCRRRDRSPVGGAPLEPYGAVDGLPYVRCPESGSLFLAQVSERAQWAALLADVAHHRRSPGAFHAGLAQSRADSVYAPKMAWIHDALRLQELVRPRVLEVVTPPSHFTPLLRDSGLFAEVETVDEMALAASAARSGSCEVAILLESLDRVDDPAAVLEAVHARLQDGGLVFVTALVASGFDLAVLGLHNLYLYPPDRANCFSLRGLTSLLERAGFSLLEVSTPGVLDVEIVKSHAEQDGTTPLSPFERQLISADADTQAAFQTFLQQQGLSSFARIVGRKRS